VFLFNEEAEFQQWQYKVQPD